ncbi:MAG: hypothetical protein SWH68_13200 [Thermodesulfobacteriota bacterium]|nr:hypothetical protein [Thermodesulfobacteriota bacterium]
MNTANYGGKTLSKSAKVMTNDPASRSITLTIKGPVEKFVDMSAKLIRFSGAAGKTMEKSVTIRPAEKYPFKITRAYARSGKNIDLTLEELPEKEGYRLVVKNTKTDPGTYFDYVYLKTDSKVSPTLKVRVRGSLFQVQE